MNMVTDLCEKTITSLEHQKTQLKETLNNSRPRKPGDSQKQQILYHQMMYCYIETF